MIRGWSERRQLKRDEFGMEMLKKSPKSALKQAANTLKRKKNPRHRISKSKKNLRGNEKEK